MTPVLDEDADFRTLMWVKPPDLNAHENLFGGALLQWIDEYACIFAVTQLGNYRVVTKYISEVNFVSSARQGDLLELVCTAKRFGRTSMTVSAKVRNLFTRTDIVTIDEIIFVNVSPDGRPVPHGYTDVTNANDRIPERGLLEDALEPNTSR